MAEKTNNISDKDEVRVTAKGIPIKCIGNVCYNPDTRKVEVTLDRKSCPEAVIKAVVESVLTGAETEFILPKKEKD